VAGKRTGKRTVTRGSKKKNGNLRVFVISLMIVLAAGSLAMLGYAAVMPKGEPEAPIIVDFAGLGQQDSPFRDESAGTTDDAAAGETDSQPVSSEQEKPTV